MQAQCDADRGTRNYSARFRVYTNNECGAPEWSPYQRISKANSLSTEPETINPRETHALLYPQKSDALNYSTNSPRISIDNGS